MLFTTTQQFYWKKIIRHANLSMQCMNVVDLEKVWKFAEMSELRGKVYI